jgi:hypothetical protein
MSATATPTSFTIITPTDEEIVFPDEEAAMRYLAEKRSEARDRDCATSEELEDTYFGDRTGIEASYGARFGGRRDSAVVPVSAEVAAHHAGVAHSGSHAKARGGKSGGASRDRSADSSDSDGGGGGDGPGEAGQQQRLCKNPDCGGYAPPYSGKGRPPEFCGDKDCHDDWEARRKRFERAKLQPREDLWDPVAARGITAKHGRTTTDPIEGQAGRWESRSWENPADRRKAKQTREKAAITLTEAIGCKACADHFLGYGQRAGCPEHRVPATPPAFTPDADLEQEIAAFLDFSVGELRRAAFIVRRRDAGDIIAGDVADVMDATGDVDAAYSTYRERAAA